MALAIEEVSVPTQSGASTITTGPVFIGAPQEYSVQVDFTGTLAGTIKLQCSNTGSNFQDITGSSQTLIAGQQAFYSVLDATYKYVRAVWTPSGGTGNITFTFVIKNPAALNR